MNVRFGVISFCVASVTLLCGSPSAAQPGGFFNKPERVRVNSPFRDIGMSISADGLRLFLYSERPGLGDADIFLITRASNDVPFKGIPVNLGRPVNSPAFDGGPSISTDGRTLYFASDRPGGFGDVDLYVATKAEDETSFKTIQNLKNTVNSPSRDAGPSVSTDGLTLFFASERGGNRDIWMVSRHSTHDGDGNVAPFENPVRLPDTVNSPAQDGRPSISRDGRTLFFFSTRSDNYDIWYTTRIGESWSPARRVDSPVNTRAAEAAPTISRDWPNPGARLYFCSNRHESGDLDFYQATWVITRKEIR